jgi:hypothetical protein
MKNLDEIERTLETLSRKPPPAGLKQRVLEAALQKENQPLFLNSVFRTTAVLSCMLFALAIFSDRWITRSETRRLSALLERSSHTASTERETQELLAELGVEDLGRGLSQWMLRRYKIQKRTARSANITEILSRVWEDFDEDQD